jgi:hypothetical protein
MSEGEGGVKTGDSNSDSPPRTLEQATPLASMEKDRRDVINEQVEAMREHEQTHDECAEPDEMCVELSAWDAPDIAYERCGDGANVTGGSDGK